MKSTSFLPAGAWPAVLAAVCIAALVPATRALELQSARSSPYDLAVTGKMAGVPAGQTRYIRWADLRALPTTKLKITGEFMPGEQEVTALFLTDLWKELPRAADADTLLATCVDDYASIYKAEFMVRYRPFVVLEINGKGPETWPPAGLKFNPGPYVITVSADVVPDVAKLLDAPHKRPWGVATIELANYAERLHDAYSGKWAQLTPQAQSGREIWVNSCLCCHRGPGNIFSGSKAADRPFEVLVAHATYNTAYFKRYVLNPQGEVPSAKMEAHPHYTDAQLNALIAFITAQSE